MGGPTAVNSCIAVAVWAISTASSRVFLGRHYFLDVVAGCLLGVLETAILVSFLWVPEKSSSGFHALLWQTIRTRLQTVLQ